MERKRLLPLLTCLLCLLCILVMLSSAARTPKYPHRPVQLVIPFSAGNASDIFARQYATITSKYLGQDILCVNIAGDQTNEAVTYVYEQLADGYTIMEVTPSLLLSELQILQRIEQRKAKTATPVITTDVIFRDEFEPLLKVQADIQLFGVSPNSRFESIDEMISYAKEHPGKVTIGGVSPKGLDEYIARGFAKAAGIEWTYVSYASSNKALDALLNGELDIYQDKMIRFLPLAQSGEIKPIIILHDKQIDIPGLRKCPASVEIGIPFTQGSWRGFVVKKGTPQEIKDKLIHALKEAYKDPEYTKMSQRYLTNIRPGYLEANEWQAEWNHEYEMLVEILK